MIPGLRVDSDWAGVDALVCEGAELALQAARSGMHVLLLQPFRLAPAQTALLRAEPRIVPAFLGRYLPSRRQVHQEVEARNLGRPGLIRLHDWDPSRSLDDQRIAENLDLVCWLMKASPNTVYAAKRDDEYVQVHLGFDGDAMALIDIDARPVGAPYGSLHLVGSRGAAYVDDHHNMQLLLKNHGIKATPTSEAALAWKHLLRWYFETFRSDGISDPLWSQVCIVNRLVSVVHECCRVRDAIAIGEGNG